MRRLIIPLVAILAFVAVAAGRGGGDDTTSTSSTPEEKTDIDEVLNVNATAGLPIEVEALGRS